jgi:hypothetical protein
MIYLAGKGIETTTRTASSYPMAHKHECITGVSERVPDSQDRSAVPFRVPASSLLLCGFKGNFATMWLVSISSSIS